MAEDDSMNDGELLGMASAGGPRGVSVQDDLVQPQPMGVAMMHADSASNHFENEFSQGGDVRGCAVQAFRDADQASPRAESPGRAAAEPGTVEATEALPPVSGDFSAAALQQRVELMLVKGGDEPAPSGWPACCAQVRHQRARAERDF